MSDRGRVYRRCACRDADGRQYGPHCTELVDTRHGTWTFAVDLPSLDGRRRTMRRGGFATKAAARAMLDTVVNRDQRGIKQDDRQTVADYLQRWLDGKRRVLKPTTLASYERYTRHDIVPELGAERLERLHHDRIQEFVNTLDAAGRGAVTIRRIVAVLSSALADGVRRRRLECNAAADIDLPSVERGAVSPWSAAQAGAFLARAADDPLGPLFEVLAGCGLRRGEALALCWSDVDLEARTLLVRRTVSCVAGRLVFSPPKTPASAAAVGIPTRAVEALKHHQIRQTLERAERGASYRDTGLVFARPDGAPLRPEYVLRRLHALADEAGVPRTRLHDMRHLCATLMLAAGVPLATVSKRLRHTKVGITVDLYGHHSPEVEQASADKLGDLLDAATAEHRNEQAMRDGALER